MNSRPSVSIATIFGEPAPSRKAAMVPLCILLLSVLPMCSNPFIEKVYNKGQSNPEDDPNPGSGPEIIAITAVSGVNLNLSTLTLMVSETETLIATVRPQNTTNQTVTWTSSDEPVATVSGNGIVSALTAGTATITVTTVEGNHTASCTVTVKESTGEVDTPFLIKNELELRQVGTGTDGWVLSAHYKLAADITMTQGEWTPIGDNSRDNDTTRFTGSFNGNNKTITGLSIDKPNAVYQGMFGYIGTGGEVKNLTLADCNVSGKESVGGVVGRLSMATIINCRIAGNVSGNKYVGGVAGYNIITIVENCYYNGNVSGKSDLAGNGYVGGVVGVNDRGTITNCNAEGDVSGETTAVGGVVGSNNGSGSEITNCYATANVYGKSEVGGVVGYNTGTVENSYATGNVSGIENYVGGVAGRDNGTITNCKSSGDVSGLNNVGGVAGYTSNTIKNCYATGDVDGNNYVGGVVGYVYSTSTVENSYATGNVSGYNYVGGVSGRNIGMVINCYATGNVSGNDYVGGVVGGGTGTVKNCVALNPNINSMNTQYGRIIGIVTTGTITNSYARRDMKVNNGASIWTNDISGEDGADITPAEYSLESWWSGSAGFDFSATGVWAWHNASGLPVLYSGSSKK